MGSDLDKFKAIADKYAPQGIKIRYKRGTAIMPAHANLYEGEMLVPRPKTREALYIFLHECGHFHLKHFNACDTEVAKLRIAYTGNGQLTRAHEEFEAEQWAMNTMRMEGLKVPQSMIKEARKYVRQCMKLKPKHDAETPGHIQQWANKK